MVKHILQPRVISLLLVNFLTTVTFGVLFSSLELILASKTELHEGRITAIMGVFLALNYASNLLGGFIGGRLLSYRFLFLIALIMQIISCLLFMSPIFTSHTYMVLSLFVVGLGVSTPCISMLLTQIFSKDDTNRETIFLWNYAAVNLAFTLSFILAGYFQLSLNFNAMFTVSCAGNVVALILLLLTWRHFELAVATNQIKLNTPRFVLLNRVKSSSPFLILIASCLFASFLIVESKITDFVLVAIAIAMVLLFLVWVLKKSTPKQEGRKILAFILLIGANLAYWTIYQLMPTGMVFFIDHNVNRHLFSYNISPQFFNVINSLVVVAGGIVFPVLFKSLRKKTLFDIPVQFSLSLFMMCAGLLVLLIGTWFFNSFDGISPYWVVVSYVLQSIGELLIAPIGIAMIGTLAPEKLRGIMMGTWMLFSGVAAATAGKISDISSSNSVDSYIELFIVLAVVAFVASTLIFLSRKFLRRLIY